MTTVTKEQRVAYVLSRHMTDIEYQLRDAVTDIMVLFDPPKQWKPLEELTERTFAWVYNEESGVEPIPTVISEPYARFLIDTGHTHYLECERPEPPKESTP